jgi:hypothetical protein
MPILERLQNRFQAYVFKKALRAREVVVVRPQFLLCSALYVYVFYL